MLEISPQPDPEPDPSPGGGGRWRTSENPKNHKTMQKMNIFDFLFLSKNVSNTSLCHLETPIRARNIVFDDPEVINARAFIPKAQPDPSWNRRGQMAKVRK